jgi:cysteine synthase A
MPDSMSVERRKLLSALGAQLVLTEASLGMQGAIDKAVEIFNETENAYIPLQFANRANPQIHRESTAPEIWEDTSGRIDIFVASVGTGGTITGVGEILKKHNPEIEIVAVEPAKSAVLSGESAAPHGIQGIGAGFVPDILNSEIYDEIIRVTDEEAIQTSRALAKEEGLLVGISSGANVYAASLLAQREENQGKVIVTILCDTGERYLSSDLYG